MISISRLVDYLVGDRVVFDEQGDPVKIDIPTSAAAAVLVSPVTDAVKRVDGDQVESLDRDRLWAVEALILDREVLSALEHREWSVTDLLGAVCDLGYSWQVSPIFDP